LAAASILEGWHYFYFTFQATKRRQPVEITANEVDKQASVPYLSVVTLGQTHNEHVRVGRSGCGFDLLLGGAVLPIQDVLLDTGCKESGLLTDQPANQTENKAW
jgi:hypothetical protein